MVRATTRGLAVFALAYVGVEQGWSAWVIVPSLAIWIILDGKVS